MGSKEIKSLLKEAKDATVSKDYEKAIDLCKEVLKTDRDNYMALVFMGAAMQETDKKEQAPKAFKKAAALLPVHILAWQGLSAYYEKYSSDEPNDYLLTVYQKLLSLESDKLKWCSIFKKLVEFTLKSEEIDKFVSCVEEHISTSIPEKKEVLWPGIVTVLTSAKDLNQSQIKLLHDALSITLRDPVQGKVAILQKLYELKKLDAVIKYAIDTEDSYAKEIACKMFGELSMEEPNLIHLVETDIAAWCDSLFAVNSASYSGMIAKAASFMKNSLYPEARDLLETCVAQHSKSWHAHCMLSKAHLQLLCYYDAELSAEAAKKCDPDEKFGSTIDSLLAEALVHSNDEKKWNSCIEICKKLLIEDRSNILALECMCRAYIKLEKWDVAKKLLTKLEELSSGNSEVSAMLLRLQLAELADKTVPPLEILLAITVKHPNSPEAWYQFGMQCLQKDDIQEGMSALFKAGRLAPYWYKVYFELGNYFMTHDLEKARCCYKKALYLNKRSSEVAMALSDIYRAQGEVAQNMELLTAITKTTQSKWAWMQLGLQHFELKDVNAAVKCFLAAIRIDVQDSYCWEVLGDAYLARKAYTAAQKSYQKVVQLRPDALYPQLQIARIKLITGEPEEVVPEFRKLAEENPLDVPVLKGLAEACLQTAKEFHFRRLIGCARDYLQEALNAVTSALKEWSDISCLWKLLGDIFIRTGHLPPTWSFMEIPSWFDSHKNQTDETIVVKGQITFFKFATLCYSQALKLLEKIGNCSLLWHDLAVSYCLRSKMSTDNEDKKQLMQKAFAASKKSICFNPTGWENWNLLGVIARSPEINERPLAQHCFIQSILNEEKNAVAWTNLGVLYMELEQKYLANQAFRSAQRIDDNYVQCWIGQALLAESENHSETLDLFRHTTQLGFHPESSSGYAQHVLLTMQDPKMSNSLFYEDNIIKTNAVTLACDAMTWYTEEREDDSYGFNMLGCLQEKSGLYSCAVNSFNKALELASKQQLNSIRANLGRVYIRMKNYKEAITVLRDVTESDFQTQCNIGLAYFKAGMFKEALNHFDTVLHYYCSDNDSQKKSDILIAKAAILYKKAKSKKDFYDAKTQLLECIVAKPPSVHGLFAAFSFGILQEDLVLSKSVLNELKPMQDLSEYIFHISTFFAYFKFIQGDLKGSVKSLEKSVHRQPWQASLWFGLALLILEKICNSFDSRAQNGSSVKELQESARAAARCAYTSMQIGRNSMDVTKVLPVVSVCHMLSGDMKRSLSVSQHAVHLFPNIAEGWATLVAPALHLSNSGYPVHVASSVLSYVRKNLPLERALSKWMSNVERKLEIQAAAS